MHWIDPSLTAEHPSPRINVTAKGGVIEEVAGDEAGPEAGQTGSAPPSAAAQPSKSTEGASKTLGVTALVIGALALLVGLGALLAARRVRTVP